MGFLGLGDPYEWEDSREDGIIQYIREHGVEQFVNMWKKVKDINNDSLKWGDEIEYGILTTNKEAGTVRCSLRGAEILAELRRNEQSSSSPVSDTSDKVNGSCNWVPEYGSWMVEGTPQDPYSGFAADLMSVERNMRKRRARLLSVLQPDEICPTVPCFPLLGVGQWTEPPAKYARPRPATCPCAIAEVLRRCCRNLAGGQSEDATRGFVVWVVMSFDVFGCGAWLAAA